MERMSPDTVSVSAIVYVSVLLFVLYDLHPAIIPGAVVEVVEARIKVMRSYALTRRYLSAHELSSFGLIAAVDLSILVAASRGEGNSAVHDVV